jgi:glyoxalase-like protein
MISASRVAFLVLVLAIFGYVTPINLTLDSAKANSNPSEAKLLSQVDHIIYATPDLDRGIAEIEKLTGVRAKFGGQHPGRGTRNALVALGRTSYMEIIAPDPDQPEPMEFRSFGVSELKQSKLVSWAAKGTDLTQFVDEVKREGIEFGPVTPGSRKRPDGVMLSWTSAAVNTDPKTDLIPFFIDWGKSPHPADSAPAGLTLIELRAEHPEPERVQRVLNGLGLDLVVRKGPKPALIAVIKGPHGTVEIH